MGGMPDTRLGRQAKLVTVALGDMLVMYAEPEQLVYPQRLRMLQYLRVLKFRGWN